MSSVIISGDVSGTVTLQAPSAAGSTVLTLPTTSGTVVTTAEASALTTSGNLTFTGTGNRITGDFSNATHANRVAFQSSTANTGTSVTAIANGTGSSSQFIACASSDPDNSSRAVLNTSTSLMIIAADKQGTGSYLPMTFNTNNIERLRISTSGNIEIGEGSSVDLNKFTVYGSGGGLFAPNADNVNNGVGVGILGQSIATSTSAMAKLYMSGGNSAHAGCLVLRSGSVVTSVADFYNTSGAVGLTMDANGALLSKGGQAIGYGTGAGGSVTQATSKSTGVTRNSPTGLIIMNNAALAAGAAVGFEVTNSLVAIGDTVIVTGRADGVTPPENYRIEATYVYAGHFGIRVTNVTAGSLSQALNINFAIIKGSSS